MRAYVASHIEAHGIQRVARALARHAPSGVSIVDSKDEADLVVHHVVGVDNFDSAQIHVRVREDVEHGRHYAVVQYCAVSAEPGHRAWASVWPGATCVWSYLNLSRLISGMRPAVKWYRAPLGIDDAFLADYRERARDIGVLTTGYVAGPGAEAIEEVARAAARVGLSVLHVGPYPERMRKPPGKFVATMPRHGILSDEQLAGYYRRARWVSGLRHVEGFELPAVEGLSCGARPIMFRREDAIWWHGPSAAYVDEAEPDRLVDQLEAVLARRPEVAREEIVAAREKFSWAKVVGGFWTRVIAASSAPRKVKQEEAWR